MGFMPLKVIRTHQHVVRRAPIVSFYVLGRKQFDWRVPASIRRMWRVGDYGASNCTTSASVQSPRVPAASCASRGSVRAPAFRTAPRYRMSGACFSSSARV